jgi:hypothetical protein
MIANSRDPMTKTSTLERGWLWAALFLWIFGMSLGAKPHLVQEGVGVILLWVGLHYWCRTSPH